MRLLVASAVAGLLALSPTTAWSEEKLFLYNWTDYTSPEAIKKFEAETGIKVTIDTYDSNETLLAKLKAGASGYDVIIPSHNFVPILIDEKLVQKYDAKAMPNFANVEDRWKNPDWDKNQEYTAPFHWGTTSVAYREDLYGKKPRIAGRILHPRRQGSGPRERLQGHRRKSSIWRISISARNSAIPIPPRCRRSRTCCSRRNPPSTPTARKA